MPTSDGVCWISAVDWHIGGSTEEIEIYDNSGTWYIKSTTGNSAMAVCINYDQAG